MQLFDSANQEFAIDYICKASWKTWFSLIIQSFPSLPHANEIKDWFCSLLGCLSNIIFPLSLPSRELALTCQHDKPGKAKAPSFLPNMLLFSSLTASVSGKMEQRGKGTREAMGETGVAGAVGEMETRGQGRREQEGDPSSAVILPWTKCENSWQKLI